MTEIPNWLLVVLVESLVLLAVILGVWIFISLRRRKATRKAVNSLVEQIRQQSKLRLEETGSFLEEKYRFEGDELKKAVEQVDKAEKLFFQRVINLYLKRDDGRLQSLDAWVAELVDSYKSLSPVSPAPGESAADEETLQKLEQLQASKEALEEELKITKATMSSMIAEFGNMFGGGKDNEMDKSEVVEKVVNSEEVDTEKMAQILEAEPEDAQPSPPGEAATPSAASATMPPADAAPQPVSEPLAAEEELLEDEVLPEPSFSEPEAKSGDAQQLTDDLAIEADEEIDELLGGIDLSVGEELEPPK